MSVPVVDSNQKPLMPTTSSRARRWIRDGKATPFWKHGVFCVRLNVEPSARNVQTIAVGIDPGSKKEGFTVKSASHTYLNLNVDAVTWVKDAVATRRMMRRNRRYRKTPYRVCRSNRKRNKVFIPPSTKARWQWKLRLCNWLAKMYPIEVFVIEDIKAITKKDKDRWNRSFSPLECGKTWFYDKLSKLGKLETKRGYETKALRDLYGLKKTSRKMENVFSAHCVDSWVLANSYVGGHTKPDNENLLCVTPLRFHRRQLHRLQPGKDGIRHRYGGTRSLGFKKGSLVRHPKYGVVYVGGHSDSRVSLHRISTGNLLCQNAKPIDCKFLAFNSMRWKAA